MAQLPDFDAADIKRRMNGAIDSLKHDFGGLRTGRASTSLLDPVMVDAYGAKMPISQCASVSVPEPRMLQISVWDRGLVIAVEKAIQLRATAVEKAESIFGKSNKPLNETVGNSADKAS